MEQSKKSLDELYSNLSPYFSKWEKVKDMIDLSIDFMLNLRQSGHPGGSRSKVHILVVTLLSGAMRWDIRHPEKTFSDRFVLVAGHTNPLVYAALAVLNEALRRKYKNTGDSKYLVPDAENKMLLWEDLLTLRHTGGLPGHAEMAGKTLFFKFNTGPSGHGSPVAAGEALALKLAGAGDVRVFALEGEGGLTPGGVHETQNSAWGLGLDNFYYLVDWNDFGIDNHRISSVIYGTPDDWFKAHGWRVNGTEKGMEWEAVTRTMLQMVSDTKPVNIPNIAYFKTKKGRGYGIYDNKSHGIPHQPMNSTAFWESKKSIADQYRIDFAGFSEPAPPTHDEQVEQTRDNFKKIMSIYDNDPELVDYVANRLLELADMVPEKKTTIRYDFNQNPLQDEAILNYNNYPDELFVKPGEKTANRSALAKYGAWINAYTHKKYGRPLFIVMSADLADSTNISGFAKPWGDFQGWGVYNRDTNPTGSLLPQEITEFANAGISVGLASVNFAKNPFKNFGGFCSACSTYGSFVYLKYGLMRLFSQLAQDCDFKVGKVLWVAGHSGPETAEDSRTHFGIFSPGVTQLFPEGHIINLYPWEHNEVAVMIGSALNYDVPIIALHLTRPPIEIPNRTALGMPSHFAAAKGAYLIRDYDPDKPRMGTIFIQGTSTTSNVIKLLPQINHAGLNVKLVAAVSYELFKLQPESYQKSIVSEDDWIDSTVITNAARRNMYDWLAHKVAVDYALSSDWDNRWRTGGTVEELCEEAHISPEWIFKGIKRFAEERMIRLNRLQSAIQNMVTDSNL